MTWDGSYTICKGTLNHVKEKCHNGCREDNIGVGKTMIKMGVCG